MQQKHTHPNVEIHIHMHTSHRHSCIQHTNCAGITPHPNAPLEHKHTSRWITQQPHALAAMCQLPRCIFQSCIYSCHEMGAISFYFLHSQKMTTDGSSPFCLLGSPPVNQLCFGGTQQQVCTPASCCWSILICHFISKAQGCKIGKDTKENRIL